MTGEFVTRLVVFSLLGLALVSIGVTIGLGVARAKGRRSTPAPLSDVDLVQELADQLSRAVRMTELVWGHSGNRRIHEFAGDVANRHSTWLGRMAGWLDVWGEALPDTGEDADDEEASLRACSGPRFDALFLQMMLRHHEQCLTIAEDAWEHAVSEYVSTLFVDVADGCHRDASRIRDLIDSRHRVSRRMPA